MVVIKLVNVFKLRVCVTIPYKCNYSLRVWPFLIYVTIFFTCMTIPYMCDYSWYVWLFLICVTIPYMCDYYSLYVWLLFLICVTIPDMCDYAVESDKFNIFLNIVETSYMLSYCFTIVYCTLSVMLILFAFILYCIVHCNLLLVNIVLFYLFL